MKLGTVCALVPLCIAMACGAPVGFDYSTLPQDTESNSAMAL